MCFKFLIFLRNMSGGASLVLKGSQAKALIRQTSLSGLNVMVLFGYL